MSSEQRHVPEVGTRLGYLLKHAGLLLEEQHAKTLAPFGIDGRELGILLVIAGREPSSQQEVARRLGVDRSTMVALLDALEARHLVTRQPDPADRRRNVVALTKKGDAVVRRATAASDEAEAAVLSALKPQDAERLRALLATIVTATPAG